MTRLTGYQPQYFPRLHYFARFLDSEVFAVSDYLQYVRRHAYPQPDGTQIRGVSYQAHTPIKSANGVMLLDVPVRHGGNEGRQPINEAHIDYTSDWQEKHAGTIYHQYRKAPMFERVFPSLSRMLKRKYETLAHLSIASILWGIGILFEDKNSDEHALSGMNARLPIPPFRLEKMILMSESGIAPPDKANGRDANSWLVETCKNFSVDEYYFGGTSAAVYLDKVTFINAGIKLVQQKWVCAPYVQQFPKSGFAPNLSIIDLLMNEPPERAREILLTRHV